MESVSNLATSTKEEQTYKLEQSAFENALSQLKSNRNQTINTLQGIVQQLLGTDPTSSALNHLVAQINDLAKNPNSKDLMSNLNTSLQTYQDYLNGMISSYESQNQQIIQEAQAKLKVYEAKVSSYTAQNQAILQKAIHNFNTYNTQIQQTFKALGIECAKVMGANSPTCTGLSPKDLDYTFPKNFPTKITDFTPSQTIQALQSLGAQLDKSIKVVSENAQAINNANQEIAQKGVEEMKMLLQAKTQDITQALNNVMGLSLIISNAFHNAWVNYANGKLYGIDNASEGSYTYKGTTYDNFVNNSWNCVLKQIVDSDPNSSYTGFQASNCSLVGIGAAKLPPQFKALGLNLYNMWNTLFNVQEMQAKIPAIMNSNCAPGNGVGGASWHNCGNTPSLQTMQNDMTKFFNFMNGYVGSVSFNGNFANSEVYTKLEGYLDTGNLSDAKQLVQGYQQAAKNMISTFQDNPVWIMSIVPNGSPTSDVPDASKNVKDCWSSQFAGANFPQINTNTGKPYTMCGYSSWARSILVGYFGFGKSTATSIEQAISTALGPVNTAIQNAINATKAYKNYKPPQAFSVPNPTFQPQVPTPTSPSAPLISTNATPLPQLKKPTIPLISFSTSNFRSSSSLRLGMHVSGGYQKYFSPFLGIAYYGYLAYRYAYMARFIRNSDLTDLNRYTLGFGANLLSNFYTKISKRRFGSARIRAYGMFGGLLGTFNIYGAHFLHDKAQMRTGFNVDAVAGLQMRVDRYKWSMGVRIPIIQKAQSIPLDNGENLEILENYKHPQFFLNFTTIF
ncbi:hypothetical protein NHP22001_11120 [Helicobacter sp. NHP22-001]|nr:hypothetical protein NHP22001_11120 [Helicobacter sp. NHP22-001]